MISQFMILKLAHVLPAENRVKRILLKLHGKTIKHLFLLDLNCFGNLQLMQNHSLRKEVVLVKQIKELHQLLLTDLLH